MIRLHFKILCI